ncbi:hypothetical protein [Mycolicibacterium tusciae]|uniref:hypothetical protein n=1 Tax=Mycolicibacterium tusciae TaxID=75922 RepID=UPI00024A2EBC|nr:hypothetical protein [Mycolicibacterium tusciae]
MTDSLEVSGTDLRYLLTAYLFDHGPSTIAELVDALTYHGFHTAGRPPKAVSDALRWEVAQGRVLRMRRGRYCPASMPRATEHRIHMRVLALHDQVAEMARRVRRSQHQPGEPAA